MISLIKTTLRNKLKLIIMTETTLLINQLITSMRTTSIVHIFQKTLSNQSVRKSIISFINDLLSSSLEKNYLKSAKHTDDISIMSTIIENQS